MKLTPTNNNLLLGAAFAGLGLSNADAATVYNESIQGDLAYESDAPTDLTSFFTNFLTDSMLIGSLTTGSRGTDDRDYATVYVSPNTVASIPYTMSGDYDDGGSISLVIGVAGTTSGDSLATSFYNSFPSFSSLSGTLDFTTPDDGLLTFRVRHESANATMHYQIGAVPEPGTSTLGLAGLAAAALHRRRKKG